MAHQGEQLKQKISKLERARGEIAVRFAAYVLCPVEKLLAIRAAFAENRKRLGQVSQAFYVSSACNNVRARGPWNTIHKR